MIAVSCRSAPGLFQKWSIAWYNFGAAAQNLPDTVNYINGRLSKRLCNVTNRVAGGKKSQHNFFA